MDLQEVACLALCFTASSQKKPCCLEKEEKKGGSEMVLEGGLVWVGCGSYLRVG